jgi:hypothetical protein
VLPAERHVALVWCCLCAVLRVARRYVSKKTVTAPTGGLATMYELAEATQDEFGATAKTLVNQVRGSSTCHCWRAVACCF